MRNNIRLSSHQIVSKIKEFDNKKLDIIDINPFNLNDNSDGVIFFKPEICSVSTKILRLILDYFIHMTELHSINIQSIYIISGSFLIKNNILNKIYMEIRKYSLLSTTRTNDFTLLFADILGKIDNSNTVIGSLRLVKMGYSPSFLMQLWLDSGPASKIADNLYVVPCLLNNKKILLVNGFFPYQVEQYRNKNCKIIFFTFKTEESFYNLKQYFQGSIDSTQRHKYSIRQYLFNLNDKHLLDNITISRNGIHMSSTCEQGMREIEVFIKALKKQRGE